jgi:hypothetical protein
MILDTVIYGDVTLWNLVTVAIVLIAASIVTQIIQINLKKGLSDRLRKNELEILLKVIRYSRCSPSPEHQSDRPASRGWICRNRHRICQPERGGKPCIWNIPDHRTSH